MEFEIETRSGGFNIYTNSYTKSYDFIQWTDTSQNTVELQIDTETFQVAFPDGLVSVIAGMPLWTDVSDWTSGSMSFNGRSYDVSRSTRNGYSCWYLRAELDGPDDFDSEYWNIYYDVDLGFLVFYGNIDFDDISTYSVTATLEDTNLRDFMFLGGLLTTSWVMPLLITGIIIELAIIGRLALRRRSGRK